MLLLEMAELLKRKLKKANVILNDVKKSCEQHQLSAANACKVAKNAQTEVIVYLFLAVIVDAVYIFLEPSYFKKVMEVDVVNIYRTNISFAISFALFSFGQ